MAGDPLSPATSPTARCFNSRPHVAGDGHLPTAFRRGVGFNSRPHVAGDKIRAAYNGIGPVSIHARTWRATTVRRPSNPRSLFQFTPARGGRPYSLLMLRALLCFNSRPHVAGDAQRRPATLFTSRFNSRPHVAGDLRNRLPAHRARVSIHARTWRATNASTFAAMPPSFNSRPHVAGDPVPSWMR